MLGPMTQLKLPAALPWWCLAAPVVALLALYGYWGLALGGFGAAVVGVLLIGAVLSAVHHAEVVAHRVGEPMGSLLLAGA